MFCHQITRFINFSPTNLRQQVLHSPSFRICRLQFQISTFLYQFLVANERIHSGLFVKRFYKQKQNLGSKWNLQTGRPQSSLEALHKENSHITPRNCSKDYPATQVALPQDMPLWDKVSATTVPKARQRWAYSRQCEDS